MRIKISVSLFIVFICSCQTYQITPGSERIRVFETEPKTCIFAGEISSIQEDTIEGKIQEPEMSLPTRIDLRNKAYTLGGNVLVFMKNSKDKKLAYEVKKTGPEMVKTEEDKAEHKVSTTFLATTFRCPASVVNQ